MPSTMKIARNLRDMVSVMRRGGYYGAVMKSGPELNRVKRFLRIMAGEERPVKSHSKLNPEVLPVFPGLSAPRFYERKRSDPVVRQVESYFKRIREEFLSIPQDLFVDRDIGMKILDSHRRSDSAARQEVYFRRIRDEVRSVRPELLMEKDDGGGTLDGRKLSGPGWHIFPVHLAGTRLPTAAFCPAAAELIDKLPSAALRWPFAYVMFSVLDPWFHLGDHYSTDMLRVRCHLPLVVPKGCHLDVAGQTRPWQEGRALFFNDAFLHNAYNRSSKKRAVLILDLWHHELTPAEIAALEAGFRKSQIRRISYDFHLEEMSWGSVMEQHAHAILRAAFEKEDQDPLIRRFWKRGY